MATLRQTPIAALTAVCISVPVGASFAQTATHQDANVGVTANVALTASSATAPTWLDVVEMPFESAYTIVTGYDPPASSLVPTPYTSLYTVISNAVALLGLPLTAASLALTLDIEKLPDVATATYNKFTASLFEGLPASINGLLAYDRGVVDSVFGLGSPAGASAAATLTQPVSASAAAPGPATAPTLLDILELPIETALTIITGYDPPTSSLVPTPYTSLYTVISNAIALLGLPVTALSLALTLDIEKLPDVATATYTKFTTSLFEGLPASISGMLAYDANLVQTFTGASTQSTASAAAAAAQPPADTSSAPATTLNSTVLSENTTAGAITAATTSRGSQTPADTAEAPSSPEVLSALASETRPEAGDASASPSESHSPATSLNGQPASETENVLESPGGTGDDTGPSGAATAGTTGRHTPDSDGATAADSAAGAPDKKAAETTGHDGTKSADDSTAGTPAGDAN